MKKRMYAYLAFILIFTNFLVLLVLLKMENCEENKFNLVVHSNDINSNLWHKDTDSDTKVSVIIRQFETFSFDLRQTVATINVVIPDSNIFIITNNLPYPPLNFNHDSNVQVVIMNVKPDYDNVFHISKLQSQIKTKYVLLVPDGVRLSESEMKKMMHHVDSFPNQIIASRVIGEQMKCLSVNVDFKNWTVSYKGKEKPFDVHHQFCDMVTGSPVLLIPKKLLFSLSHPFELPMPLALFLQTAHKNKQVVLTTDVIFTNTNNMLSNADLLQKYKETEKDRFLVLYKKFGIKKVISVDGSVQWYGCSKKTTQCFQSIRNYMPDYIYEGRWTPPCCLEALRITARHVIDILNQYGVRYWLEGGSLLGALRDGDIIPWDNTVSIGIYIKDVKKCIWLNQIDNSQRKPLIDEKGFIWERAKESGIYTVQYSLTNKLHVNIFPFHSYNKIMKRSAMVETYKEDLEFPEKFLLPFSSVKFVGTTASAPNNIREFLELKYGKDAIENPERVLNFMKNNSVKS